MLPLSELLAGAVVRTAPGVDLESVPLSPRELGEGTVFFKLRAPQAGASAAEAIGRGARFVVLEAGDEEAETLPPDVPHVIVDNVNRAFARACSRMFGDAHRRLTLIGVTGTKGKTTVCHLVEDALRTSGIATGMMSSLAVRFPGLAHPPRRAMPPALALHAFFAELVRRGGTHAVLELHAKGIADERFSGLRFDSLAVTNLGGDDAWFQGGLETYTATVRRLFAEPEFHKSPETLCVFNGDDPVARDLARSSAGRVVTFGFGEADLRADAWSSDPAGVTLSLGGASLRAPLVGKHNAENVLAAAAILNGVLPLSPASLGPVPGRLEKLTTLGSDVDVYTDYAHMPEDVEATLAAVREIAGSRRIVAVMGCTARTGKGKRALVARTAMEGSDLCILTNDDPGREHPASIVMDMLRGVPRVGPDRLKVVIDRPTAIDTAVREARPGGIVVLMGKGILEETLRRADRHSVAGALREVSNAYELNHR